MVRLEQGRVRPSEAVLDALAAWPDFEALWRRRDVREKTHSRKGFRLPGIGDLELDWERLSMPGGLALTMYTAAGAAAAALSLPAALDPASDFPIRS